MQKLANNTCYSKTDHKIISLLPAEIIGSQDADNNKEVSHHGEENDGDEYEGLKHSIIIVLFLQFINYELIYNLTLLTSI